MQRQTEKRKITSQILINELKKSGTVVTEEQAEKMLAFLYFLAELYYRSWNEQE